MRQEGARYPLRGRSIAVERSRFSTHVGPTERGEERRGSVRHLVGRVGLRTLLCTVLVLGCLLAVATGLGLTFPAATFPFALNTAGPNTAGPNTAGPNTAGTASPRSAPRLEHPGADATPTTGCGKLPPAPPGVSIPQTLTVGALNRQYRLHVSAAYQASTLTPLVLSFHGRGSSAIEDERLTWLSQLADLHGFIAVYPQGVAGPGGATGWNTGRNQDPAVDDVLFVDTLLTHLQGALCVDQQRIYATGFSNGGGLTAILACDLADRIAAFAPVAGDYYPQPEGCHPTRPASIVEIHGTADTINPYYGSAQLRYPAMGVWLDAWAERDGCVGSPSSTAIDPGVTAVEWSACQGGAVILHYRLIDAGHVWPVHVSTSTSSVRGGSFDATTAVWAFLERFTLPPPDTPSSSKAARA